MCIISVYEKGLVLNEVELKTCFQNNPDGAGLMYQTNKGVHIEKGFMTWDGFWARAKTLPTDVDRVFHFRIATSGKVSVGCCHPFPVCDDYKKMRLAKCDSRIGFAHNGVLSEFTPKEGMKSDKSDTMVFNHDVVYKLGGTFENSGVRTLLELYTTSRLCFMTKNKVYITGTWHNSPTSGAWYSNTTYEESRYSYWGNYGYGGNTWENEWDDYEYLDEYGDYIFLDKKYSEQDIMKIVDAVEEQTNGKVLVDNWIRHDGYVLLLCEHTKPEKDIVVKFKGKEIKLYYVDMEERV